MRKTASTSRSTMKAKKLTLTKETVKELKVPARGAGLVKGGVISAPSKYCGAA